jgi:hypothetical protein
MLEIFRLHKLEVYMTFNGRKPFTQIPSQQDMLQKTKEEQPFKRIFFAATTSSLF